MKPYRSCSCRDPGTGKPYPSRKPKKKGGGDKRCPLLVKSSSHGAWFARFEVPSGADGKRRQIRVGPCATEGEAKAAVVEALGKVSDGKHVDDRKTTLGEYLDGWLKWKRGTLAPSTFASYAEGVALYFEPASATSGSSTCGLITSAICTPPCAKSAAQRTTTAASCCAGWWPPAPAGTCRPLARPPGRGKGSG